MMLLESAPQPVTLVGRLRRLHWPLIFLLCAVAGVGVALLVSAASGNYDPWASRQIQRFAVGLGLLFVTALLPIRFWFKAAIAVYVLAVALLVLVEFAGVFGGGAARWINLGFIRLQPSEVMKIALVLALARYFHWARFDKVRKLRYLVVPIMLVLLPAALVLKQPDLGTAVILGAVGAVIFFLAGVRLWKFAAVGIAAAVAVPIAFNFLRDYQKQRLVTFLDPDSDPLGAGYHIIQSKIALGSGGVWGKGYMQGTQIHLNFLPEMHTDFIFSILAEEFGMIGGLALLAAYCLILFICLRIAVAIRHQFGRLLVQGIAFTFFLYVFINMAMVMGLIPVVGVPLPLVSYGGTSMLTLMFGFGLVISAWVHRGAKIGRFSDEE